MKRVWNNYSNQLPKVFILSLLILPTPLFAQTEIRQETSQPSNTAPSTIFLDSTVNTANASAFGDLSAVEALRAVPGAQIQTSGSLGEQATVRLRGTTDDQNLVLFEGVPLNSPFDNAYDFGYFPLNSLSRIDIFKGAQSGYYGSTAIGGAINMVSHAPDGGTSIVPFFYGGSFATFHEGVALQHGNSDLGVAVNVSRLDKGDDLDNDAYSSTAAGLHADWKPTSAVQLSFISQFSNAEKNLPLDVTVTNVAPFTLSFVADENRSSENLFLLNTIKSAATINRWYTNYVQLAYYNNDATLSNTADTGGSLNPNVEFTQIELKRLFAHLGNQFLLYPGIKLEVNYELTHDIVSAEHSPVDPPVYASLISDDERTIHAPLARLEVARGDWLGQLGARLDSYSDFGETVSPQARVSYHYRPYDFHVEGGYSRGFRAPSLREIAAPIVGNPDLSPETAHVLHAGIQKDFPRNIGRVNATYFINYFEDLIAIGALATYENVEEAISQGVESELCLQWLDTVDGCISYTYINSELTDATGAISPIPLISEHNGTFNINWRPLPRFATRLGVNYRGPQPLQAITGVTIVKNDGTTLGNETDAFTKVDFDASYKLIDTPESDFKSLTLILHTENLLNQDIEEFPGFPNPGISVLGGLRAELY